MGVLYETRVLAPILDQAYEILDDFDVTLVGVDRASHRDHEEGRESVELVAAPPYPPELAGRYVLAPQADSPCERMYHALVPAACSLSPGDLPHGKELRDTVVFESPLMFLAALADGHGKTLAPHELTQLLTDARKLLEPFALHDGTFRVPLCFWLLSP